MRLKALWRRWFSGVGGSATEAADAVAPPLGPERRKLLESQLGYQFRDRSLLDNALLHRSHSHATGAEPGTSNERLEFLGDAVLGVVVNEFLYREYPLQSEGDLTKIHAHVPLPEMLNYSTELRSITSGEGEFRAHIARYDRVPPPLDQAVIEKHKKEHPNAHAAH